MDHVHILTRLSTTIRLIQELSFKYKCVGSCLMIWDTERMNAQIELKKYCKTNQSDIARAIPELKEPIEAWVNPNPFVPAFFERWYSKTVYSKDRLFENQLESALFGLTVKKFVSKGGHSSL
jgi:hypothetical protein